MLITIANNFDPDPDRQIVDPDLDTTVWHSESVPERIYGKSKFEKSADDSKSMKNYLACKELITVDSDINLKPTGPVFSLHVR